MTGSAPRGIANATGATFANLVLASRTPVVVDFWAPWCPHCRTLDATLDELAAGMAGDVAFVKVNVDEEPDLARGLGVSSLPTLKLFCGGRQIGELMGARPKRQLESEIRQTIGVRDECGAPPTAAANE
jgi:thioredoxin 1